MKPQYIIEQMNECGKTATPFLFAVDFALKDGFFVKNPTEQAHILFRTPLGNNQTNNQPNIKLSEIELNAHPISYEEYKTQFDVVLDGLMRGDSYLCNLTVKTPISTNISLKDIFQLSRSPYGLLVPDCFVCFSPERFVKISEGKISTNPMKGTISANIPNAEQKILSDPKETAEHNTIVDLLRNDLGMVAENIEVSRFRYIDRIPTKHGDILQVSSEIRGDLPKDYLSRLGDIIFRMLPAGSICGAPKESTVDIINRAEPESRGYYTGIFGYFDGKEFDSAVLIRFIQKEEDKLYFHSGGGITVNSQVESEYEEVIEKIYFPFL